MNEAEIRASDPRTPGRRQTVRSSLARADLLRRVRRLGLDEEAAARVVRLLEREVEQALAAREQRAYTPEEIEAASEDEGLLERLRARRADAARVEAIRSLGLADLTTDELERVIDDARAGGGS